MNLQTSSAALAAFALLVLTGCSSLPVPAAPKAPQTAPADTSESAASTPGHGKITGAAEAAEPQLHLVSVDAAGEASMLDLLDGTETGLGRVQPPAGLTTDGRYVFTVTDGGVDIIDSGVWTWDHTDHFHYYRAESGSLGRVSGAGAATIATGPLSTAGTTGMFFPDSGEAVLLDNSALANGNITETLRLSVEPHAGTIAPLGDAAVVTEAGAGGMAARVRAVDSAGRELASAGCPSAAGTITTRAGVVMGCADGAVIASMDGQTPVLQHVPYPDGAAAPATAFDGRKGRPVVAGLGDDTGVWLLDTRSRTWDWLPTAEPLLGAAAADDAAGHVIAVTAGGAIQVYSSSSKELIAKSGPLLDRTLADPELRDKVQLAVDGQRAYVSAPAEGVVYEVDYADGARIARMLELSTRPDYLAETGR